MQEMRKGTLLLPLLHLSSHNVLTFFTSSYFSSLMKSWWKWSWSPFSFTLSISFLLSQVNYCLILIWRKDRKSIYLFVKRQERERERDLCHDMFENRKMKLFFHYQYFIYIYPLIFSLRVKEEMTPIKWIDHQKVPSRILFSYWLFDSRKIVFLTPISEWWNWCDEKFSHSMLEVTTISCLFTSSCVYICRLWNMR